MAALRASALLLVGGVVTFAAGPVWAATLTPAKCDAGKLRCVGTFGRRRSGVMPWRRSPETRSPHPA
jgi:hypothetical protein